MFPIPTIIMTAEGEAEAVFDADTGITYVKDGKGLTTIQLPTGPMMHLNHAFDEFIKEFDGEEE